ncbi:methyltransferase domain-containing protein [Sporomusa malonica]|uniref:Trans-aconitate 2-methyltransferase n=1 Tax=Sporomusa malonica TaxID=112901 RepID=A0A1W2BC98_9FIRM|nr:methyltransferase domain-containing protein [Sporomusa malonica]SMC70617.1 trans-aconitate 2-methyltransferase [Sporomusa malonica]
MKDWNPNLYLKFEKERTQPVIDLISRIEKDNPERIIDIGCGPGNSTRQLKNKWPQADITGLDSSPNMIQKAKENLPGLKWVIGDAGADLTQLGKFDIVFSNAAIQWIPNNEQLLPKLFSLLKDSGILAVQVPNITDMGIKIAIQKTVEARKWNEYFVSATAETFYYPPQFYYDILSRLTSEISLWETHYYHVMDSHKSIVDWYTSTGLRPLLDKLPNEDLRFEFSQDILRNIETEYNFQQDGKVLFRFRRIFFTASK